MLGEIISHYRVVEKLGGDGMGKVDRAQDPLLRRDMTNKVLPVTVSFDLTVCDVSSRISFRQFMRAL